MKTDVFNHGPAKCFVNTGSPQFGRPSMGAWVTYGLGSECDDLPGFVVLQSGPRGPRGGAALYSAGFLPSVHQGVPFLKGSNPILDLAPPPGVDKKKQGEFVEAVKDLNRLRLDAVGDPKIETRIAAYEMAYRMQTSAPELTDLSKEDKKTLEACTARRPASRPSRPTACWPGGWSNGACGSCSSTTPTGTTTAAPLDLGKPLDKICKEIDRPTAALVADLKRRGLLDSTLVVWGGEFGRTPMGETRETIGRDHHIDAYTMWLAGGGVKPGLVYGQTDDIGYNVVENPVHVHDLQATILHQLGLDHTKLTFRFQGRDYRLTDVHGTVVKDILA